jgi:hypothetical protein
VTLRIGARFRVINRGPHDGKIGVVVSTDRYIVGVEIDDGVTAPVYPSEIICEARRGHSAFQTQL